MGLIACSECGYTGTTHPGEHPHDAGSRCLACKSGTMVKYVPAEQLRGAVAALERFGWHHLLCPAIEPKPRACTCGWTDVAKSLGLRGGE